MNSIFKLNVKDAAVERGIQSWFINDYDLLSTWQKSTIHVEIYGFSEEL